MAFVLNKKFIKPNNIVIHELHQGHALALKIKWHASEDAETVLLNIYAPNDKSQHVTFWENIETKRRMHRLRRPNFMLGDFNVTEENIDRSPAHPDDPHATSALREICHKWNIQDTWRHIYPNDRCFTYRAHTHGRQTQSRLDRIYIARETSQYALDWKMQPTPMPTDHWLVMIKYAPGNAPNIGPGRWTWPIASLQNEKLMTKIITQGIQLQNNIDRLQQENIDRNISNPQRLWQKFEENICMTAKHHNKETLHKVNSRIKALTKDLKETTAHPNLDTDDDLRTTEALLANELTYLARSNARTQKEELRAKLDDHGEKLGGIWSAMSKETKPRDLIRRLKIPDTNPPQYERRTERMAQLARDYHDSLQRNGMPDHEDVDEYEHALHETLSAIPNNQKMEEPTFTPLHQPATQTQTVKALRLSKNGSATGLDGCPYELWKTLHQHYNTALQMNKNGFNIAKTLTKVFNDIQEHSVDPTTDFAIGWMCPIYKKKDPTDISNYRPITLMNTDYKLLTKVLALQLTHPIHSLVHEDQAGFIPH